MATLGRDWGALRGLMGSLADLRGRLSGGDRWFWPWGGGGGGEGGLAIGLGSRDEGDLVAGGM